VVTIPYNIVKAHQIKNGTVLRISVQKLDEEKEKQ